MTSSTLTPMRPQSLGFRTDLRVLELAGSLIENRGTHLVVRSPDSPSYFWGNFILLAQAPVPGGEREVVGAFHTEFPDADHISIGIDAPELDDDSRAAFEAAGLAIDVASVLTAERLTLPREVEGTIRPLRSDDDWEARALLSQALYSNVGEQTFLDFARGKNVMERRLVDHGVMRRYGAFVDGQLVSTAGVVLTHAGWARFQSVETHPDHRRRGLAAAVVYAAGEYAVDDLGAVQLVIVADHDGEAIRVYRSLGFTDSEQQLMLEKRSGAWAAMEER